VQIVTGAGRVSPDDGQSADQAGRQARLNGRIAQALVANAPKLLLQAPSIERIEVLGAKFPGSNLLSQGLPARPKGMSSFFRGRG